MRIITRFALVALAFFPLSSNAAFIYKIEGTITESDAAAVEVGDRFRATLEYDFATAIETVDVYNPPVIGNYEIIISGKYRIFSDTLSRFPEGTLFIDHEGNRSDFLPGFFGADGIWVDGIDGFAPSPGELLEAFQTIHWNTQWHNPELGEGRSISGVASRAILVPEPMTFALLGVGLIGMGWMRKGR